MTTARFSAMLRPTIQALTEVKTRYCAPPNYRPAKRETGFVRCPACGGQIRFTVSAVDGRSDGRCNSTNCVNWSNQ